MNPTVPSAAPSRRAPPRVVLALGLLLGSLAGSVSGVEIDKPAVGTVAAKLPSPVRALLAAPPETAVARLADVRRTLRAGLADDAIEVRLDAPVSERLLATCAGAGATVVDASPRWSSVVVRGSAAAIAAIAADRDVHAVHLARRPHLRTQGSADNHADIDERVAALRTLYGVDGSGRMVGVVSDSIHDTSAVGAGTVTGSYPNATLTGTIPQASGDLPPSIRLIAATSGGNTDEGEAMLEVVHDLAPGAPLAFAPCGSNQASFASAVSGLAAAGCSIIVDDIAFLDEPFFQDGPVAQAMNAAHAAGAVVFSAAGNEGDTGIIDDYRDIAPGASGQAGDDFHDWGIGGATPAYLPIDVPAHDGFEVVLQWNQPFHSYGLGAGAQSDLDLYILDAPSPTATVLGAGDDVQGTTGSPSGDPVEIATYTNTTAATKRVYLVLDHFHGVAANRFRLVFFNDFAIAHTGAMTIFGHPTATGVNAVGAIYYRDVATPSADPSDPAHTNAESFSSRGGIGGSGIPIWFDTTGQTLPGAPQLRDKPDLAAVDGVNVLVFSHARDIGADSDSYPNFFGTSCAAPNAAGAAAVAWSAMPGVSNDALVARLKLEAVDIVATSPPSGVGADDRTGAGLIDARAAVPARVASIASTTADGVYTHATTIDVRCVFSDPITIDTSGGVPTLLLGTAPTQRVATYVGQVGGTTLDFAYAVQDGDSAHPLDVANSAALVLNGATITDALGLANPAVPAPGSPGSLSATRSIVIDAVPPALTITASPAFGATPAFTFTLTFSHAVTGLSANAIAVVGGTRGAFAGSGAVYTVQATASAPGDLTLSVPAGAASDADGRASLAGSGVATYDVVSPSLAIVPSVKRTRPHRPITATFAFSEPVVGFSAAKITVTGGTAGAFPGSGASYALSILAGDQGTLTITASPVSVADRAGNPLIAPAAAVVAVRPAERHRCGTGVSIFGIGLSMMLALRRFRRAP